ncbi:MAG: hypothetical protein ACP5KG_06075 [Myxococcota bacterium]
MERYAILLSALIFIIPSFLSCNSNEQLQIDEYEGYKRIIYGRINKRLSFDENSLNIFLSKNEVMGVNSLSGQFKVERIKIGSKRNLLKMQQYFMGYKVFGHTIVIHTDRDNMPIYFIDNSFPLESFQVPDKILSEAEARERLLGYLRTDKALLKPMELGIVTYTKIPLLRYRVKAFIPERPFDSGTFDIDATSGEVIRYEPALISTKVSILNTNNENVEVEISKNPEEYAESDCADTYCAVDTTRGQTEVFNVKYIKTYYEIEPAQYPGELPPSAMLFSSSSSDVWDGVMPDGMKTRRIEGISAHYAVQRIYDWYSSLGLSGNVGKGNGLRVYLEEMAYDPLGLNAFWDIYSHSAMVLWVYQPDENRSRSFASSYDVIGHEFTHGVLSAPLSEGGLAELEYNNEAYPKNESASVQEGLADVMGSLSQGSENPNWLMGYNGLIDESGNHKWLRNDSDPYDADALTWGDKEYIGQCTQRLCSRYPPPDGHKEDCQTPLDMYDSTYICATTIAYPAWKIKNAIGIEKTSKIYFNVIDKYLQKKELIPAVSQYVFDSCLELYNNQEGECCEVYKALTESKFTINLRGIVCGKAEDAGIDVVADSSIDVFIKDAGVDAIPEDSIMDIDNTDDILDTYSEEMKDADNLIEDQISIDEGISDSPSADDILPDIISEDISTIDINEVVDILEIKDAKKEDKGDSSGGCSCSIIE